MLIFLYKSYKIDFFTVCEITLIPQQYALYYSSYKRIVTVHEAYN